MGILELLLISIGLGMDAFAVAICKGISMKKMDWEKAIIIGLYFGGFQSLIPLLGYILGKGFENIVTSVDHWIAFTLLGMIGFNMIREALSKDEECMNESVSFKTMIVIAIATSIDALAVGITFAFLKVNILMAVLMIGIITFALSVFGTKLGNKFGGKFGSKAEFLGGIILILIGTKILLEHLGILII